MKVVTRTPRFTFNIKAAAFYISCRQGHSESKTSRLRLRRQMKKQSEPSSNDSFIFHPLVRTIEPINQALRLTKTIIHEDMLPSDSSIQKDHVEEILSQIYRSVDFNGEDQHSDLKLKYIDQGKGFLAHIVKAVWSAALSYPGLLRQTITYQPSLKMYWKRYGYNLQVSGRTGLLFLSQDPLPNFASISEVNKTVEIPVHCQDEIISPVFELSQNSSRRTFDNGFFNDFYPFPCTLVLTEKNWKIPHLVAQGIMFSFGRLVERAISNYKANFGDILECPLSLQTVVFNDKKMALLCYQLNTLDFENNEGIKNQMWLKTDIPIIGAKGIKNIMKNKDGLKSLVSMFLYGQNDKNISKLNSNI